MVKNSMDNRGISPIIATILLVSMTVALGGIVVIWVNSESGKTMDSEGQRREQIADRKNEMLELVNIDIDMTNDRITFVVVNIGTSDSLISYFLINDIYVRNTEFRNPLTGVLDPETAEVGIGETTTIELDGSALPDVFTVVEMGTQLRNTYLYTAPSAVILVESTFFNDACKLVVLDGSRSVDADGSVVLWEWDLCLNDGPTSDGLCYDVTLGNFEMERTGSRISVDYPAPGTYQVALRVTDNTGMTSIVRITIVIPP